MIRKILFVIVVLIAAVMLFAFTKPDTFNVQRSISINAPAEAVHANLVDFHKWNAWSPWEKMDPAMKRTYSGPTSGKGAAYAWEGNSAVGKGSMKITNEMPTKVDIKLNFSSPMETTNDVSFVLSPHGNATDVVWTMSGESNYLSKFMQVFASMDSMIGKDFESGLADLKKVSEQMSTPPSASTTPSASIP